MHELSICQSIVDGIVEVLASMAEPPKRLVSARIVVGELRQIVPDFMQDAYRFTTKGTSIEGSTLEIRTVPRQCACRDCDWTGELHMDEYECRGCGSGNLAFDGGTELYLENLEVET